MHQLSVLMIFAWVLWSKSIPIFGTPEQQQKATWEVVESTTDEAQCRRQAIELERRERLNMSARVTAQCFPDTVDPRPRQ